MTCKVVRSCCAISNSILIFITSSKSALAKTGPAGPLYRNTQSISGLIWITGTRVWQTRNKWYIVRWSDTSIPYAWGLLSWFMVTQAHPNYRSYSWMQHCYYNYMYIKSTCIETNQLLSQWQKYEGHVQIPVNGRSPCSYYKIMIYSIGDLYSVFKQ